MIRFPCKHQEAIHSVVRKKDFVHPQYGHIVKGAEGHRTSYGQILEGPKVANQHSFSELAI